MNKIILISILIIFFSINLYGGKHHLLVKGGLGYSGAYAESNKNSSTYEFGEVALLFYRLDFDDNLGFNLGIGWNNKSFIANLSTETHDVALDNLENILSLNYNYSKNIKFLFGLFIDIPTGLDNLARDVTPINGGLLFGVEYNFKSFLFDLRIEQGLGEIYDPSNLHGGGAGGNYSYSTQIIFMVGYQFF